MERVIGAKAEEGMSQLFRGNIPIWRLCAHSLTHTHTHIKFFPLDSHSYFQGSCSIIKMQKPRFRKLSGLVKIASVELRTNTVPSTLTTLTLSLCHSAQIPFIS